MCIEVQFIRYAVAENEEIVGADNEHGTSIAMMVGPPAGLFTARTPSKVPSRRSSPRSPEPAAGSAPPQPSSITLIRSEPSACPILICTCRAPECLTALVSASATAK